MKDKYTLWSLVVDIIMCISIIALSVMFWVLFCSATQPKNKRPVASLYLTNKDFDYNLISTIKKKAYDFYKIKVVFRGKIDYPPKDKDGYLADSFTTRLDKKRIRNNDFAVAVTDVTIIRQNFYDENWLFVIDTVLGYTNKPNSACIISNAQFKGQKESFNRTINVVMHELGHLMGLGHCEDDCLMVAFGQLDNDTLCWKCKRKLNIR